MEKKTLAMSNLNLIPKSRTERQTHRMTFQMNREVIGMISTVVDSKGSRGAIKEALSGWICTIDHFLVGTAIEKMNEIIHKKHQKPIEELIFETPPNSEERTLFQLFSITFVDGSSINELFRIKEKVSKTYTLTNEAKKSLLSISKKLSLNKSETLNLVAAVFCKNIFERKKKKELEEKKQASAIWPLFDDFSDSATEALNKLQDIYDSNGDCFDPELSLRDLILPSEDDSNTEKAIGLFIQGVDFITESAGIIWQEIEKSRKEQ